MILNAAKQVIYRGYADNVAHANINKKRKVKQFGIGMETYKKTDVMWDWSRTDQLSKQIPVEQLTQFQVGELEHILYIKIELTNEFV